MAAEERMPLVEKRGKTTSVVWKPMFPLSCAHAQLRTAGTVSAHRKSALRTKKNLT